LGFQKALIDVGFTVGHADDLCLWQLLGDAPAAAPQAGPRPSPAAAPDQFSRWMAELPSDPDVGQDARMMVPVFYDVGRRQTKVWGFLGWTVRRLSVDFATPPRVATIAREGGAKEGAEGQPEVRFAGTSYSLMYPVMAEVYVTQVLNRDEFRRLCDRYKTRSEILANLK
jgi:hypothetical protein